MYDFSSNMIQIPVSIWFQALNFLLSGLAHDKLCCRSAILCDIVKMSKQTGTTGAKLVSGVAVRLNLGRIGRACGSVCAREELQY